MQPTIKNAQGPKFQVADHSVLICGFYAGAGDEPKLIPFQVGATGALTVQGLDANGNPVAIGAGSSSTDGGPAWTTVRGVAGVPFTSADQHSAVASVTDAPTAGQKLVITDLVISTDTAMSFSFTVESSATVIYGPFYLGANQTVNLVTRGKLKLGTADKKLQVKTSVAGNISVLPLYYSEA